MSGSGLKLKESSNRNENIEDCSVRVNDTLGIIKPPKGITTNIYPIDEPELNQQFDTCSLVSFEEELARLELETLDDFVDNALGSFQLNPLLGDQEFESELNIPEDTVIGPRGKYTIRSAKVRHSADHHRHIISSRRLVNETDKKDDESKDIQNLGSEVDIHSVISSGTIEYPTSSNLYVLDNSLDTFESKTLTSEEYKQKKAFVTVGRNSTIISEYVDEVKSTTIPKSKTLKEIMDENPVKVQVNGSVGVSSEVSGPSGVGPTAIRRNPLNSKQKILTSEPSFYAQTDVNILRSDLLSAVEQNKSDKVRRILSTGVDPNSVCDEKGRWPLHIACLLGHLTVAKLLLEHGAQKDQPDTALERTPLMYAAATSKETLQLLLAHRADIHAKNKFGATCLHYAAGAGQADCCRLLCQSGSDVNGRDRQKMTPLLMAARVDDIWSIEILLEYGGDIHGTDIHQKSSLHHAAETFEGMDSDYGKMGSTFRKLVSAGITVNAIDQDGKTALFYAIATGSAEAVMILYELGAELMDGISLLTMSKKFPNLIPPFLDKCVSSNIESSDVESKQFYIQFDYTCLTVFPKDIPNDKLLSMQHREETESILREMGVLHGLTRCKDTSILSHPVCESLLRLKWKKVKWYLYLDMLLFAVFLAFLTAVIFMEYESDNPRNDSADNSTIDQSEDAAMEVRMTPPRSIGHERYCMDSSRNIVVWSILWVLTATLGIREMVQLIQAPLQYIISVENMLELVLVSSVALLSLAECGVRSFVEARDHFAAVCLIVGWTIQVTLYGKIPVFGVYIRMFAAVAVNILKCMFTYLGLLFAFSLTLHFLFRTQKDFDSVGFTFLKTFAMMIGEVDLARTFIDSKSTNAVIVPFTSHLVVALFIIFISIILSSLFIALAVCDISSMQREGEYMQLVQQVKVSSQLEDALQKRSLLYPQFGMRDIRALHQRKGVIFPNLKDHGKLSKDALEIVMTQHTKKLDPSRNVIAQQTQIDHSSVLMKSNNEMADDLLEKLKDGMDKYSQEMKKKVVQDAKVQDRGTSQLAREVLLIKSQLEDMNTCLRELCGAVKSMADRTLLTLPPSPQLYSRKKILHTSSMVQNIQQQSVSPVYDIIPTITPRQELEESQQVTSPNTATITPGSSNETISPVKSVIIPLSPNKMIDPNPSTSSATELISRVVNVESKLNLENP